MKLRDCDKLLYAISVYGELKTNKFYEVFDAVCSDADIDFQEEEKNIFRFSSIRFLESLGHCEMDYSNRCLYVCNPCLICVPSYGIPKGLLTGARSPELFERLKRFANKNKSKIYLEEVKQPVYSILPPALSLVADCTDTLKESAAAAKIDCQIDMPASWHLLQFSSSCQSITNVLNFEEKEEINWIRRVFSSKTFVFSRGKITNKNFSLVEYTHPVTQRKRHWFWRSGKAAVINRDWGRFTYLSQAEIQVLVYDRKKYLLAVPTTVPLPLLIARAVTLITGLVPKKIGFNARTYWLYSGVFPQIAATVAEKLGQTLFEASIQDY